MRETEDTIQKSKTLGFETLTFALSLYVRCRSASTTALSLGISDEEEKCRSFQKLKTAAQVTKEVYASVMFHDLRLSSDILSAYHLILV